MQQRSILLVDDNPGDVRLIREALRATEEWVHLDVAVDGAEAIAFLRRDSPNAKAMRPDLILLDLNLPRMTGLQVLAEVKKDPWLKTIPTIILSSSEADADVRASYKLAASCYLTKPVQLAEFEALVRSINDFWMTRASLPRAASGVTVSEAGPN